MADFIYIDGVEYKADKELIDLIKGHANSSLDNSFKRQMKGADYYFIGNEGVVHKDTDLRMPVDNERYEIGNYCANEELLKKRAADGLYVASYRVGCNKCKIYFTRNSEFRLADGQLEFKVNGYDLAVNLWNTRAKIVDNSEDVNSFVI